MHRASYHLVTCVLLVATGLGLLGLGAAVSAPRLTFPAAQANTTLVRDFYDAVNRTLATGEVRHLDAVVAPTFVSHGLLPTQTTDLAAFGAYLVGLGEAFADLRLDVGEVVAGREVVMTRVSLGGGTEGEFAGVPVAAPVGLWGAADRFRIAGDRIVELWSDGGGGADLRPLFASLPFRLTPGTNVLIDRFRLTGGEGLAANVPRLVYLEAGALELTVLDVGRGEGRAPQLPSIVRGALTSEERQVQTVPTGRTVALQPGDLLRVPSDALVYRLQVPERQAALGLSIELLPPEAPGSPDQPAGEQAAAPGGAADRSTPATDAASPPVGWVWPDRFDGSPRWTAGRITLGPGAAVAIGEIPGPALLAVERGTLAVAVEQGDASDQGSAAAAGAIVAGDQDVLAAGTSALLQPGAKATLRNAGAEPVSVLLIAVVVVASDRA